MASGKVRTRDANRFHKKYSRARIRPKPQQFADYDAATQIEAVRIKFDLESSYTFIFKLIYPEIPVITATAVGISPGFSNVNVFVSEVTKTYAVIEVSEPFIGEVHVQVMGTITSS